jgi:hypothetical protein
VSLSEISDLMRRHLVAVVVVFVLAVAIAWGIKRTPPVYLESANVVFTPPAAFANPYTSFTNPLIQTADVMTRIMLSPDSRRRAREAGGTADFNVGLVNLYNEQFPYYGVPYVTLTTTSVNPVIAHRTFTVATLMFQRLVSARQAQAGVPPKDRISINIVSDTGPIAQVGSSKRVFAGLLVLAIMTAFLVACFLDRHPIRPRVLLRPVRSAQASTVIR